jgi:hypothetical protein
MSHLVYLDDQFVSEAEAFGAIVDRSSSSQIEFWAILGQIIERRLPGKWNSTLFQLETTQMRVECESIRKTDDASRSGCWSDPK